MPRMLDDEAPDRKYWTEYDHFMVEREARAMRRAYAYALFRSLQAARAAATRSASAASSELKPVRPRA